MRGPKSDRAVSAALTLLDQEDAEQLPSGLHRTSRAIWQLMQSTGQRPHSMRFKVWDRSLFWKALKPNFEPTSGHTTSKCLCMGRLSRRRRHRV